MLATKGVASKAIAVKFRIDLHRAEPGLAELECDRCKTRGGSYFVMAGLVPAISIIGALCPPDRDRRDEPGDDAWGATSFAPLTLIALKFPAENDQPAVHPLPPAVLSQASPHALARSRTRRM